MIAIRHVINALLKGLQQIMSKPSWKHRRRYILASFVLGAIMLIGSTVAALTGNGNSISELVTGGVALITIILTSYVFAAVWEDKTLHKGEPSE